MRLKSLLAAATLALSLSGCSAIYDMIVFQIDVPQGNFVEESQVDKLTLGMTKEQVTYVMGSPMLVDSFDSDKWYYIYYLKPGGEPSEQSQMELVFYNGKLARISGDDAIAEKFSDKVEKYKADSRKNSSSDKSTAPCVDTKDDEFCKPVDITQ